MLITDQNSITPKARLRELAKVRRHQRQAAASELSIGNYLAIPAYQQDLMAELRRSPELNASGSTCQLEINASNDMRMF